MFAINWLVIFHRFRNKHYIGRGKIILDGVCCVQIRDMSSYLLTMKLCTKKAKAKWRNRIVELLYWKLFSNIISKTCFKNFLQWWITNPRFKNSRNYETPKQTGAFEFVIRPGCLRHIHTHKRQVNAQKTLLNSAGIWFIVFKTTRKPLTFPRYFSFSVILKKSVIKGTKCDISFLLMRKKNDYLIFSF